MSEKTKFRLLHVKEIMEQETDENNPISIREIEHELQKRGIQAKKRSILDSLKSLDAIGCRISFYEENNRGYYLKERLFSEQELGQMIDAVYNSPFISAGEADTIAGKLKKLASRHSASRLRRRVYSAGPAREQAEGERRQKMETLLQAVDRSERISFHYSPSFCSKNPGLFSPEETYTVTPRALVEIGYSFLLAATRGSEQALSVYPVEIMENIELQGITDEPLWGFDEGWQDDAGEAQGEAGQPGEASRSGLLFRDEGGKAHLAARPGLGLTDLVTQFLEEALERELDEAGRACLEKMVAEAEEASAAQDEGGRK